MKKILASLLFVAATAQITWAQSNLVRPSSLAVSFILNDFTTAQRIRSTSFNAVIRDKQWASVTDMDPGIAVTYFKGLTPHIDFAGTLGGSFPNSPIPNRPNAGTSSFFLEADASFNFKMFPDNYWVSPYLIAGIGGSRYQNYYGAFVPLGGGVKVNFFEEATLFITQQYRIPITPETNSHHFVTSIGLAGVIGKRKQPELKPTPPPPPADTDNDGIIDSLDRCPTVAGIAKYNGCPIPDTDRDGINDEEDQCPNVAGVAKYKGCPIPDTDNDGINDESDRCPTVAGTAKYNGCPIPRYG
jgi:OOP family OmpA-OmpF porin